MKYLPIAVNLIFYYLLLPSCKPKENEGTILITANNVIYSKSQAEKGAALYQIHCASCHGVNLRGTEGGNALVGERFINKWNTKSIDELFKLSVATMPKSNPHSLGDDAYLQLIAYVLNANDFPAGEKDLSLTNDLSQIMIGLPPRTARQSMQFNAKKIDTASNTIEGDWRFHRSDPGSTNYSSLDQINKTNVKNLKIAWRWKTDNFGPSPEYYFKATPLMAKGILYTTAGSNRAVAAIDGETGETIWTHRLDEKERQAYTPRQNSGRGVAYWSDPHKQNDRIIYITPGFQLVALNARSGQLISEFGNKGIIDLKKGLGHPVTSNIGSTSPPMVINNVIIIGSCFPVGLAPSTKNQFRGDIIAYDVKTGKQKWIFHSVPQAGEEGNDSWQKDSWKYSGNTGAWSPFSADPALGYVYIPFEAATGDFYGGHRPGNNLYSQSLVCLDIKTGKKVWHYQTVHHDIWDYDLPAPPILADLVVNNKKIKAVIQVTKQAFVFAFDRTNGIPVWPIEERPVPASDVKGEWTSPTQPFPSKPAPFDRQGYHDSVLIDFTPDIKKQALKIASQYKRGSLYTPVSLYQPPNNLGTLMLPDAVGGANWQGGVLDPETNILYVSSSTVLRPMSLEADPNVTDMDYVAYLSSSRIGPHGLPLVKPPYGRITAIDMNSGEHTWMVANADSPDWIKNNPALKGLNIPRTGLPDRVGLLVTKSLLFAGEGSGLYVSDGGGGGNKFRAYDKSTGEIISTLELPANQSGVPMTYSINGKQYIVMSIGAVGHAGELVALSVK